MDDGGAEYDLSIPASLYDDVKTTLDKINNFSKLRPLAAIRLCIKVQVALQEIEKSSALHANTYFRISWARVGMAIGVTSVGAWERYKGSPNSRGRKQRKSKEFKTIAGRLSEQTKNQMDSQPEKTEGDEQMGGSPIT